MAEVKVKITGENEDAKKALDEVESKAEGIGSKFAAGFGAAAKAIGAAAVAAGAAVAAIGKSALDAYGDFEQLSGGAELMFGPAFDSVMERASNAWSTVQMSANEYLESVNYYAVGLREALGGDSQAAADLSDSIVTAQADIIAATGASSEAVSKAFEGVMRGNYTMLDNLGMGIAGTKEGMQQVIDAANEWHASMGDGVQYTIDSVADCEAALVDYTEIVGFAGYASAEASHTIQGSVASMQGAWQNFLVGLADPNADLSKLSEDLIQSIGQVAENITPVIQRIGDGLVSALPEIMPKLTELASGIISGLVTGLIAMMPELSAGMVSLLSSLVLVVTENLPMFVDAVGQMLGAMGQALIELAPTLTDGFVTLLVSLIDLIAENLPNILNGAVEFFGAVLTALVQRAPEILSSLVNLIGSLITSVFGAVGNMLSAGLELLGGLFSGLRNKMPEILDWFRGLPQRLIDALGNIASKFLSIGSNIINGIIDGVSNAAGRLVDSVIGAAQGALNGVMSFLGIASPSKVFRDKVGRWLTLGVAEGVEDEKDALDLAMERTFTIDPKQLDVGTISYDVSATQSPIIAWLDTRLGRILADNIGGDTYNLPEGIYADSQITNALDMLGQAINANMRMGVA